MSSLVFASFIYSISRCLLWRDSLLLFCHTSGSHTNKENDSFLCPFLHHHALSLLSYCSDLQVSYASPSKGRNWGKWCKPPALSSRWALETTIWENVSTGNTYLCKVLLKKSTSLSLPSWWCLLAYDTDSPSCCAWNFWMHLLTRSSQPGFMAALMVLVSRDVILPMR